jgi:NitT/TauT family transport system permease protein
VSNPGRRFEVSAYVLPLLPLVVVGALMEVAARRAWVAEYLVPAPSKVARTLFYEADLRRALWETTLASVAGFALSASVGLLMAIALTSARWVRRTFYPYAVLFQTVPIIAIAPMLVIWIGFGMPT